LAAKSESNLGFQFATLAFVLWGLLPIYWKQFDNVPAKEILAHRIVWSTVFVYVILLVQGRTNELWQAVKDRRTVILMTFSSMLIGSNWFVYIWAVSNNMVLETSLGYYISPMISVLLGMLFLQEKIRGLMIPAVLLATTAILIMTFGYGQFPIIGVFLASTFGFYGLFRKKVQVKPMPGLFIEALVLTPFCLIYLLYLHATGAGSFIVSGLSNTMYLAGAGAATAMPLLLYVAGANRIRLGTLGTLQYIGPTIAFFIGAFMYKEPLGASKLVPFSLIWAGVALYLAQLYINSKKAN
jgi:chloramphenicol-sensitive protein RarD